MIASALWHCECVAVIALKDDLVVLPLFRDLEAHILQRASYLCIHASEVTEKGLQATSHCLCFARWRIGFNDAVQNVLAPTVFGDAGYCISDGVSNYPEKLTGIQVLFWSSLKNQTGLHGALRLVLSNFCFKA